MTKYKSKDKKAAADFLAAVDAYNKLYPADRLLAMHIVDLVEKSDFNPINKLMRAGFSHERARVIFITYQDQSSKPGQPLSRVGTVRAASLIGVSLRQLHTMADSGEIRHLLTEDGYSFYEGDLLKWIVAQGGERRKEKP